MIPNCSSHVRHRHARSIIALLLLIGMVAGCNRGPSQTPPVTYPVSGEIVDREGIDVAGAMIQFIPANHEYRSKGVIDADGKFELTLIFGSERIDGAVEGSHKVAIYFPLGKTAPDGGGRLLLKEPSTVEPKENHLQLKLTGGLR